METSQREEASDSQSTFAQSPPGALPHLSWVICIRPIAPPLSPLTPALQDDSCMAMAALWDERATERPSARKLRDIPDHAQHDGRNAKLSSDRVEVSEVGSASRVDSVFGREVSD